jgi:hypothetical protein
VAVAAVASRRGLRAFIDLPYRLHAGDPLWAPPLKRDVRALLAPSNPFFDHGAARYFLARRDGRVVGRIAAITNRMHNETHADQVGFFGFFECEDDAEAARGLLDAAAAWVREQGHDLLRGPVSFSTNDECGVLVDGFDTPPTLLMPHNPRYYPRLLEEAGCVKAKDLFAYYTWNMVPPPRLRRSVELLQKRLGVTLRWIRLDDLDGEVERIKALYNAIWEPNWGYVPLTGREVEHLAREFRPVVRPDLVPIVEKDGKTLGFALTVPDLNQALRRNRRGRLIPGALRIFWGLWRKRIDRIRILLLGILPEYRGSGLDALLWYGIWVNVLRNGVNWAEAGWILEDNVQMNNGLVRMGWTRYKTYRLFDRPL